MLGSLRHIDIAILAEHDGEAVEVFGDETVRDFSANSYRALAGMPLGYLKGSLEAISAPVSRFDSFANCRSSSEFTQV